MTTTPNPDLLPQPETPFLGLAPFLRMSVTGSDLLPAAKELLAAAEQHPDDANLLMNLSTAMLCLGQRDLGLAIQGQALAMRQIYPLPASRQPAGFRLLLLMVPGDLAANTPLDCLLEDSDVDLDFYYLTPDAPDQTIPEHDALMVAISEADENHELLDALAQTLAHWSRPVINAPQYIPMVGRSAASTLLQDAPGLVIPPTLHASRQALAAVATGAARLAELFDGCEFPIILRPEGSHAGRDLDRIERAEDIAAYLARVADEKFFLSRFIDYSGHDGLFRKIRVALIDGEAYACHMAVSSHWMVHYVNAGMYEDAGKRAEEHAFMADFDGFRRRHQSALEAIYSRTGLDYVCIDCAETRDGQLLVFEIDHAMVVHAMDREDLFPYKQAQMQKVQRAFRDFLARRGAARALPDPTPDASAEAAGR